MLYINSQKVHILVSLVALLLLLAPIFVFAAFDDVVFQGGGDISVGGITVTVEGISNVEQVQINSGNFVLTMAPGSGIKVSTAGLEKLDHDTDSSYIDSSACNSSESFVIFDVPNSNSTDVTITVTPSSTLCSASASAGGGSSGGGAIPGSITSYYDPSTDTVVTIEAPASAQNSSVLNTTTDTSISSSGFSFTKTLRLGMTGSDILNLQKVLNSDPDTQVASSGPGSPGNETNYFGSLTRSALRKFQTKHGIVSSGDENSTGYGLAGPKTREKLSEVSGGVVTSTPPSAPSSVSISVKFKKGLSVGQSDSDVKTLQQLLNSDSDTQVASSGPGSPGNETNYFGSLTEKAVQKFQEKYGIAGPGIPGYGYVGPKTRAKLNSL